METEVSVPSTDSILITNQFQTGKDIDYVDLKRGLKELCSDLVFDEESGQCAYILNVDGKMRVGLYHKNQFISAVERGIIPEFSIYDGPQDYVVPCSIQEVLADPTERSYFEEIYVTKAMDPARHALLDAWLGIEGGKIRKSTKGAEVLILRYDSDTIIISTAWKIVNLPSQILRIGWREVFERVLAAVPSIKRHALEQKFKVDMSGPNRSGLQIDLAVAGLPTLGSN